MKIRFYSVLVLATTTSLLATASCSDRSKKEIDPKVSSSAAVAPAAPAPAVPVAPAPIAAAPTPAAVAASSDPFAAIAVALDNTTKDTTARLNIPQTEMEKAVNAQIADWKATGATSTPIEEEKLALARLDFSQKLGALSVAHDETWNSVKSDAQSSLQNLRKVYARYLAGPPKS